MKIATAIATKLASRPLKVSREKVDPNAFDVVTKLKSAGFQALLVGGCVRDLLLGAKPKDFDVATSATPEQVRRLFRRSRMVGRRFKIAHVRYGRNIVEVSTFRKAPDEDEKANGHGVIRRDNVYGALDEDAFRRDFTVNALYYDPHEEQILDYVGGIKDIQKRRLRLIGEARKRLAEDPVRLLRALRFKAKLGFDIDPAITEHAAAVAAQLRDIPPARLFDEFSKMLLSGYAAKAWRLLQRTPVRQTLFPATPPDSLLVRLATENTDRRIALGRPVTHGFLVAALLWDDYSARLEELTLRLGGKSKSEAHEIAAQDSLAAQRRTISLPRRHAYFVTDVWRLQRHLEERRPKHARKALGHPRFRAAYDFLMLRAEAGSVDQALADWWTEIQQASPDQQEAMLATLGPPRKRRAGNHRRRPKRRSRTVPESVSSNP